MNGSVYNIYNYRNAKVFFVFFIILFMPSQNSLSRSVYMNGIDISSAHHQLMENVTVRIDGEGNVYIEGAHYQVNEESSYVPLGTLPRIPGVSPLSHQKPSPLPGIKESASVEAVSIPKLEDEAISKPSEKGANLASPTNRGSSSQEEGTKTGMQQKDRSKGK